jgi:hypothetical protein
MATLSFVITVTSPNSTAVTLTPAPPFQGSGNAFTAIGPIASGVTVGTFNVQPAGWQGALVLSGADAASFTMSGSALITAAVLPDGGTYNLTATATP